MSSLRVQAMTNTISDLFYWSLSLKLSYQNLNFETYRALSSPYASNMHKSPLRRISPHEGPLLTFTRARRCTNQCWGLQLPICADPLIPGFRWLFEMCHRAWEILRTGRSGEDTLVHLGIESNTPSSKKPLVIIGHDARRQCSYYRVPVFRV